MGVEDLDRNAYHARLIRLQYYAKLIDGLAERPPGTWLGAALGGQAFEDLDLVEIGVLCLSAYVDYEDETARHFSSEAWMRKRLWPHGDSDGRSG